MTETSPAGAAAPTESRQRWMGLVARAEPATVASAWAGLAARLPEDFTTVRSAETGLVMVRGRAGGTGRPFNLGEMTVTRCTVQRPGGALGHGYVQGRNKRHAELAAKLDALLQDSAWHDVLLAQVIEPLAEAERERRATLARKAAATKVDFFTMVRGE